jgi:hypothetical protein
MAKGKSSDVTVRYTKFLGLDKVFDPIAFRIGDDAVKLSRAENVNITKDLKVKRRDGRTLWIGGGGFSSLWGNGHVCYAVRNGMLVEITSNGEVIVLATGVGSSKMSFADTKSGVVYFTNGVVNGRIGVSGVTPLGGSVDQFKTTLPVGSFVSFLSPRVLVVRGNVVYFSDPVNRDVYNKVSGFSVFESDIKMVAVVGTTLFVSDSSKTWALKMTQNVLQSARPVFKFDKVLDYPAVDGNVVTMLYGVTVEKKYYSEAAVWLTNRGVCLGGEDGSVVNLTEDKYTLPGISNGGTICYRQVGDLNLLISVFK